MVNKKNVKEINTIPRFSYKSSIIILITIFIAIYMIPMICEGIGIDFKLPTIIFGGIISGLVISYTRFFIDTKIGICRNFYLLAILFGIVASVIIFIVCYTGTLI